MRKYLETRSHFSQSLQSGPDEIDIDRAQAAKERAEQRLSNHTAEIDVKRAEFALGKALIRIDAAHHV